ncbi:MAG TPA: septal ring lytic transglycosylase RlpA family protein [Candidatus Angelobacter sp.]|nr:septal ring lytic transglycosylase RlpA family protein [Candidatus Angelobacter sp.]
MNRVLSSLAATFVIVANMAAAPVPNHQDQKTPGKTLPKTANSKPSAAARKTSRAARKPEVKPYQVGVASWYGKQFHGKTTASGEGFDMFELTAAHRQLPLGTYVKVTNLRNGKSVIVRVNDRGPYVMDRIMDLSYSAARMLNFRDGIERVRLDVVQPQTVAMARGN